MIQDIRLCPLDILSSEKFYYNLSQEKYDNITFYHVAVLNYTLANPALKNIGIIKCCSSNKGNHIFVLIEKTKQASRPK